MLGPFQDFLSRHTTVPVLVTSAVIFYSGYLDIKKHDQSNGKAWCVMGILILIAYSTTVLYYKMWISMIAVLLALIIEILLAKSALRRQQG